MATSSVVARRLPNGSWRGVSIWLDGTLDVVTPALVAAVREAGSVEAAAEKLIDDAPRGWNHLREGDREERSGAAPEEPSPFGPWEADWGAYHALWVLDPERQRIETFAAFRWLEALRFKGGELVHAPDWVGASEPPVGSRVSGLPPFVRPDDPLLEALGAVAAQADLPAGTFEFYPFWGATGVRRLALGDTELVVPDAIVPDSDAPLPFAMPGLGWWVERAAALGLEHELGSKDAVADALRLAAEGRVERGLWEFDPDTDHLKAYHGKTVVETPVTADGDADVSIAGFDDQRHIPMIEAWDYEPEAQAGDALFFEASDHEALRFFLAALIHAPDEG